MQTAMSQADKKSVCLKHCLEAVSYVSGYQLRVSQDLQLRAVAPDCCCCNPWRDARALMLLYSGIA